MNQDILVSKIVGSPNDSAWSQASSTGKLYVAISLSTAEEKRGLVALGKELLEQIQREFFALDEKRLSEIKKAIEKVISQIDKNIKYSVVVATIVDDILYIVTGSEGSVAIDRENNLAEVARGEDGQIIGFSGRIKNNDIIILETKEFNKKISNKLIAEYTGSHNSAKLAEDLAPFILEDSKGEEAAVIIHFRDSRSKREEIIEDEDKAHDNAPARPEMKDESKEEIEMPDESLNEGIETKPKFSVNISNYLNIFSNLPGKQKLILISVAVIVVLLAGSLFGERLFKANRQVQELYESTYNAASEKLESAKGLASLNRGRALEDLNDAISNLEANLSKFKEGSKEHAELSDLLNKLTALRDEIGGGDISTQKEIFTAGDSKLIESLDFVAFSENNVIAVSKDGGYAILNPEGKVNSEEEVEAGGLNKVIASDSTLYLLGDMVNRITLSNNNGQEIVKDTKNALDISFFGSNVYLLTKGGNIVTKYSGSNYDDSNYFTDKPSLDGRVVSFAINGPIYILTDKGKIYKFTRGKLDNEFSLDNSISISQNSVLYSRENSDNFYLLDIDNARIAKIDPNGKILKQYSWLELQNAKSFTISADESKAFVVINDTLYSFDL